MVARWSSYFSICPSPSHVTGLCSRPQARPPVITTVLFLTGEMFLLFTVIEFIALKYVDMNCANVANVCCCVSRHTSVLRAANTTDS